MFARLFQWMWRSVATWNGVAFMVIALLVGGLYFFPERVGLLFKTLCGYALAIFCYLLNIAGDSLLGMLGNSHVRNLLGLLFCIGVAFYALFWMTRVLRGKK